MSALVVAIVSTAAFAALTWRTLPRTRDTRPEPAWMRYGCPDRAPKWFYPAWIFSTVVFLYGIGMFLAAFYTNPRQPDASGHTYELNNHGSSVFVTKADYLRINGTIIAGPLIGFTAAWTAARRSRRK